MRSRQRTLALLWPAHASILSSRRMQALQPKIEELKVRHKNNAKQLQVETLRMYREHKVNPLSGCLMILPQFPIFIAFYAILGNAAELQGQPFVGWIQDLSEMDPYYILPILMGGSQFLQTKMMPVADPAQAKIMMFMPLIFTFMFVTLPAGVVLYWTAQNVLAILHQWWVFQRPLIAPGTPPTQKT
jgi:YidC/Oxa1 family membrane protein insertase